MVLDLFFILIIVGLVIFTWHLKSRLDRQRSFILEMDTVFDEDIQALQLLFESLRKELDMVMSIGPQPNYDITKPVPIVIKQQPIIDNGNVAPLESDTLPLSGHTIVVGQSGSGKSNVAMSQTIERLNAGHELYCVDTKNELGPIFRRHMKKIVPPEQGEALIKELLAIAKQRQALFEATSEDHERPIRDYAEYERVTGTELPLITLIVEELIVLMPLIGQDLLIQLLVLGRSAGVFVLAAAQYLKADILDRKGSVNFNTAVFLGRYDRISTGILFGNITRTEMAEIQEFVGAPGRAAISENGNIRTHIMPRVYDYHLAPYMKK